MSVGSVGLFGRGVGGIGKRRLGVAGYYKVYKILYRIVGTLCEGCEVFIIGGFARLSGLRRIVLLYIVVFFS